MMTAFLFFGVLSLKK